MPAFARRLFHHVAEEWANYHISQSAAAVAFYTLLSLAPLLVFATAAATAFLSREEAQGLAKTQLADTIGPGAAEVAGTVFSSEQFARGGVAATTASGVLLLFASSAVFVQLRRTLDRIFGREPAEDASWLRGLMFTRLRSTAFAIAGGVFLMAMLLASVTLKTVVGVVAKAVDVPTGWWAPSERLVALSPLISYGVIATVLVAIFCWLPSHRPPLRFVLVGVGVATLLFELGKWALGNYVTQSAIASAYGPSSSLVVFLLWIYYSTHIVLLGAVLSQALASEFAEPASGS